MAAQRLPVPGRDNGTWGSILNGFLGVSHNSDGTLVPSAVVTAGAVTSVNSTTPTNGNVTLTANSIGAAPLSSPVLTGTPTAPTASPGTNTTQLATTAFTASAVGALSGQYAPVGLPSFTTQDLILYVSTQGNDSNTGLAQGSPLRHIQTALNVFSTSGHGGAILVAGGTYTENLTLVTRVYIIGQGEDTTILSPATTGPCVSLPTAQFSRGGILNMGITGNMSDSTNHGIYMPPGAVVTNVTTSMASTTVTVASGGFPSGVAAGWHVGGINILAGTTVVSVSGNSCVISADPTTSTSTAALTFINNLSCTNGARFENIVIRQCGGTGVWMEGSETYYGFHQFNTFRNVLSTWNNGYGWYMTGAIQNSTFDRCGGLSNFNSGMNHTRKLDGSGNTYTVANNEFRNLFLQASGTAFGTNNINTTTTFGLDSDGLANSYWVPYIEGNGLYDAARSSAGIRFRNLSGFSGNHVYDAHLDTQFNDIFVQSGSGDIFENCNFSYAIASPVTITGVMVTNGSNQITVASGGFPGVSQGMMPYVTSGPFPGGSYVQVVSGNTLTLSQNATITETISISFYANGLLSGGPKISYITIANQSLAAPIILYPKFGGNAASSNIGSSSGSVAQLHYVEMLTSNGSLITGPVSGVTTLTGTTAPASGFYGTGAKVYNASPAAGAPVGWIQVAAASYGVGTWVPFGKVGGNGSALSGLTVTASPMTYTATQPSDLYVIGGTWTTISITPPGGSATNVVASSAFNGLIHLETGDVATFTYTAAPTAIKLQTMGSGGF